MQKCSCNEQIFDLKYAKMSEVFITNIIPKRGYVPKPSTVKFQFLPKARCSRFYLKVKNNPTFRVRRYSDVYQT